MSRFALPMRPSFRGNIPECSRIVYVPMSGQTGGGGQDRRRAFRTATQRHERMSCLAAQADSLHLLPSSQTSLHHSASTEQTSKVNLLVIGREEKETPKVSPILERNGWPATWPGLRVPPLSIRMTSRFATHSLHEEWCLWTSVTEWQVPKPCFQAKQDKMTSINRSSAAFVGWDWLQRVVNFKFVCNSQATTTAEMLVWGHGNLLAVGLSFW